MSPSAARWRVSRTLAKISSPAGIGRRIVESGSRRRPPLSPALLPSAYCQRRRCRRGDGSAPRCAGRRSALPRTSVTKVVPPSLPTAFVHRAALHARLAEVLTHRLTTVMGAAGFGKSTLLAAWAIGAAAAWYTLDQSDADLATFSRGLVDAIRLRLPGLASEMFSAADLSLGPDTDDRARADAL